MSYTYDGRLKDLIQLYRPLHHVSPLGYTSSLRLTKTVLSQSFPKNSEYSQMTSLTCLELQRAALLITEGDLRPWPQV